MEQLEVARKIVENKRKKVQELGISDGIKFLAYGKPNLEYWGSWYGQNNQEWSDRLDKFVALKGVCLEVQTIKDSTYRCVAFDYDDLRFKFCFPDNWSDDLDIRSLIFMVNDIQVLEYEVIRDSDIFGFDYEVRGLLSFVDGEWVPSFLQFVSDTKNFVAECERIDCVDRDLDELNDLKTRYGIADNDLEKFKESPVVEVASDEKNSRHVATEKSDPKDPKVQFIKIILVAIIVGAVIEIYRKYFS